MLLCGTSRRARSMQSSAGSLPVGPSFSSRGSSLGVSKATPRNTKVSIGTCAGWASQNLICTLETFKYNKLTTNVAARIELIRC